MWRFKKKSKQKKFVRNMCDTALLSHLCDTAALYTLHIRAVIMSMSHYFVV
jgi:hypothetical protein